MLNVVRTVAIATLAAACIAAAASPKTVRSTITVVTVFSDRAQVVRSCAESLPAGEHRLLFDSLPESIDGNSILANGTGPAILRDVKFQVVRLAENTDSLGRILGDAKVALEDTIGMADDRIAHAQSEKAFVENIVRKLVGPDKDSTSLTLDPAKWMKMVEFYRNKLDSLDREVRLTDKSKRGVVARLQRINNQIADLGSGERKSLRQVEVVVEMKEAARLTLDLSYVVYGPGWSPAYDVRVMAAGKKMELTYYGQVRQSTGENWNGVQLKLSTARPQIGGRQPELTPWYLNFALARPYANEERSKLRRAEAPAMMNQMMAKAMAADELAAGPPPLPMERPDAGVQTGATSVVFVIPGKSTVASDNVEHKVSVMTTSLGAEFRYSTVPKLSPYAYLKAKAKNTTDFALLPGPSNVFLDNNFVATSRMDLVAPQQEFWTYLGIDEAMKVEHKLVNRFEKSGGALGKRTRVTFEYLIQITNNRKTEEEIVVWDQLPISGHQDIKVELIEPRYKEDSPTLRKNESQFFEWLFSPKPGEVVKIPFKFAVEYPSDRPVAGM